MDDFDDLDDLLAFEAELENEPGDSIRPQNWVLDSCPQAILHASLS
jgi:hypothetical protein